MLSIDSTLPPGLRSIVKTPAPGAVYLSWAWIASIWRKVIWLEVKPKNNSWLPPAIVVDCDKVPPKTTSSPSILKPFEVLTDKVKSPAVPPPDKPAPASTAEISPSSNFHLKSPLLSTDNT